MNASLREALTRGTERLRAAGVDSARLDARVLLARALGVAPDRMFGCDDSGPDQMEAFEAAIARRAAREPLAYITGEKEFWSLSFAVGPGVLVPRPETETLVEEALRAFPDRDAPLRVLDFGTGSGCLLVAFLASRSHASGVGLDASEAALAYAKRNAVRHGVSDRCRFVLGEGIPAGEGGFDVILANPPYLSEDEFERCEPEIREHEPRIALVGGGDGLAAYRALGPLLSASLRPGGLAFVEVGAGQAHAVGKILGSNDLDVHLTAPDLSDIPRCVVIGRAGQVAAGPKNSVGNRLATR